MRLLALLILCPAVSVAAEEVYVQPEPPHWEAVRVAEVCDREMWVAIYQSAVASRSSPAQAHSRADAVAGCQHERLHANSNTRR